MGKKINGERLDGKMIKGEIINGKQLISKIIRGKIINGKQLIGKIIRGEIINSERLDGKIKDKRIHPAYPFLMKRNYFGVQCLYALHRATHKGVALLIYGILNLNY